MIFFSIDQLFNVTSCHRCCVFDKAMQIRQPLQMANVINVGLALILGLAGYYGMIVIEDIRWGIGAIVGLVGAVIMMAILALRQPLNRAIAQLNTAIESIDNSIVDINFDLTADPELNDFYRTIEKLVNAFRSTTVSHDYLDNILDTIPDSLVILDLEGNIQRLNRAAQRLLDATDGSLVGRPFRQVLAYPEIIDLIMAGDLCDLELIYQSTQGKLTPISLSSSAMRDRQGRLKQVVCLAHDITEQQKTQTQLTESLAQLRGTLEATTDGILVTDLQFNVQRYNQHFIEMLAIPEGLELIDIRKSLRHISSHFADSLGFECRLAEIMYDVYSESFDELKTIDGRVIERYSRPLWVGDHITGRVWSCRDVTQRHQTESALRHNVLHDSLTGLPNRVMLQEQISDSMIRRETHQGYQFALMFLDLDRFKIINDSLGHLVGDQLLIAFGQRIRDCIRKTDILARLGGDEFAILINPIASMREVVEIAERIQMLLMQPFILQGQEVFISTSIGITLGDTEGQTIEGMLRDADTAMYCAKIGGKAQHAIFDPKMHERVLQRMTLENDLRRALKRDELFVCYQPIVSLDNQAMCGVEALIRWQHPEQGLISPLEFIPIAEDTGMIVEIGEWVLRESCKQLKIWQTNTSQPLMLCVNLSARQLMQVNIVDRIAQILYDTRIDPTCLKLEITESVLAENPEMATKKLLQLRDIGIQIAIDDFGTGYSSLSYLHNFPINTLKIDRSFIDGLEADGEKLELVRAILTLVKSLGIDAVAEGIETSDQLNSLLGLSCKYGQGYLFSQPVAASVIYDLLGASEAEIRELAAAIG
jgi:diguanylate cyclase (GGDEF)-like protein/PAS domain S-box-containing protein